MNIKRVCLPICLVALLLAMRCPAQSPASTPVPTQPGVGFAIVGIASGQTLRIVTVNTAPAPIGDQASKCSVGLQFYDSEGQLVKEKSVADLTSGKTVTLNLDRADLPGQDRSEIRAVVRFGYTGGANPPPGLLPGPGCLPQASLQVFDNETGRTSLVVTNAPPLPDPVIPLE